MAYRLVIFDFDGTLADSAGWFVGVLNQVAAKYGFRQVDRAELEALRGRDNREIVRALGVPFWKLPLIAAHMRGLAARDAGSIPLFPGVDGMLRRLRDRGVAVAIVSSNAEANIRRVLGPDNAALVDRYACKAGLFGKAAKIRAVLRQAGVQPAQAICVGDEVRDIQAALAVGAASGAVAWGYATPELLRAHNPTLFFGSVEEMATRLAP